MDWFNGQYSVMQKISKTEETIQNCYERIQVLKQKIEDTNIANQKKDAVKKELLELQKLLSINEKQLSLLHRHNQKSFIAVAAFCFICFTVYVFYILIQGNDF